MFLQGESIAFLYTPMFLIGRTNKSHEELASIVVTWAYKIKLVLLKPT